MQKHKIINKPLILASTFLLLGLFSLISLINQDKSTSALDNDFSNGITVDSTLDTPDAIIGDTICDDGDGNCTLRAAIQEANSNPDASTINFNITGTADFTNGGEDGYTIFPTSDLPNISEQTTINGYSQPGAEVNTAIAPNPFNGILLIEIDGSLGGSLGAFRVFGDNSTIRGLAVNSFEFDAIDVGADNLTVQGCYLGTDPTGLVDKGNNGSGMAQTASDSDGLLFGGLDAEDRNIVSGNKNTGLSPNTDSDNWVIQGNYFGLDATGLAAIPNAVSGGSGALSMDNSSGHLIGGPQATAVNIISGNNSMGIAPHNSPDLVIQNNYIGTDYTGFSALPNGGDGIFISGNSPNILIGGTSIGEANIIHNNGGSYSGNAISIIDQSEVSILTNSIINNGQLGVELGGDGTTPNDPLDSDTGANDLLNFPLYTNIQEVSGDTEVDYLLDVPAGDYRIEFYSNTTPDPSGYGEGETFLGFQSITSAGAGEQSFSYTLAGITGVSNLAMTTTEIDESADGFGPTSEFGGEYVEINTVITKSLLNPQDITIGATANYQITYTNNGPDNAELGAFSTLGGLALIYDFVPADLINPSGYIADGPLPGSQIIDVGNPDLTCVYAPAPAAAGLGITTDTTIGIVICYLTGPDTILESGSSISMSLSFEVAPNSDLVFTNYALGLTAVQDPDYTVIGTGFDSGDSFSYLKANPNNNFASSPFPLVLNPEEGDSESGTSTTGTNGGLASTGDNITFLVLLSVLTLSGPILILVLASRRQA